MKKIRHAGPVVQLVCNWLSPIFCLRTIAVLTLAVFLIGCSGWLTYSYRDTLSSQQKSRFVILNVQKQNVDFEQPWQRESPVPEKHLGIFLTADTILTTASNVHNAKLITAEISPGKIYYFKVFAKDMELNAAILQFLGDPPKVTRENLRFYKGGVPKKGWPVDGIGMTSTDGVQKSLVLLDGGEMDERRSTTSFYPVVGYRIPSGKAGVSFLLKDNQLVGMQDEYRPDFAMPADLLYRFVESVRQQRPHGVSHLGMVASKAPPPLRTAAGLGQQAGCVRISHVADFAQTAGISVGDFLCAINNQAIDAEGNISLDRGGASRKVPYFYLVNRLLPGDQVKLSIVRAGGKREVILQAQEHHSEQYAIPHNIEENFNYIIVGGLVLAEMSRPLLKYSSYLRTVVTNRLPTKDPLLKVVILQILKHDANASYASFQWGQVDQINGKQVHSLAEVQEALKTPQTVGDHKFIEMKLAPRGTRIVFDAEKLDSIHAELRSKYGIPASASFFTPRTGRS